MPHDWLKKLAPHFHPIRSKIKTNRDSLARVFPRFASATCNYYEFWLAHCNVYGFGDWLEWLLWFWFYDAQLKTALLTCPKYVCDKRLIMVLGTRLRFHSRYFFAYHMSTWWTSKQRFLICFWAAVDSEVSCHILAMVLYNLTLGTRQSSRTLFPLFAAKTSSRIFDGFCKFSNKVAIPESKCLFGNRDGRLTRVAQQQLLLLRVWHFAVSLISQDENNSLLGTNNVHLDTNNSLMGSKHVFRDTTSCTNSHTKIVTYYSWNYVHFRECYF